MKQAREHWGSRLGFIMAAAGSAIGLGSLWKFPYLTGKNGGGIFVLLYIMFTILISLPVFLAELVIGRNTQKSAIFAFSDLSGQSTRWKAVGWLSVITSFIILSFYCVVSGWCVNYAFMSINHFTEGRTPEQIRDVFNTVYSAGDISLFWNFIFILINLGVVYGGIRKGIEYWSKILTPALLVLLVGLLFYSTTLSGFGQAFRFIFYPDLSKLTPSGILDALGMAFFTLSVGLGIIITYGSYMKQSENIPRTGFIISSMTILVSLMSALMIFPIIFSFNFEPELGAGLVFKTLPVLFNQMPGTLVLSSLFFLLLVFTALTSSISLFEVLVANLIELFAWSRTKAVLTACIGTFILGIPSALSGSGTLFAKWQAMYNKDFFDTLDYVTQNWMLPFAALFTTIFVGWIVDRRLTLDEMSKGTDSRRYLKVWFFCVRWLAPIAIFIIILQNGGIIDINKLLY